MRVAWRNAQALLIYVPNTAPFGENWVEQLLGVLVKPISDEFGEELLWMWVTRYIGRYEDENPPHGYELPEPYRSDGLYRHIVFRLSATDNRRDEIHETALRLADRAGCFVGPGWAEYDVVGDLGKNRFIHQEAPPEDRARRAQLIAHFIDATLKLQLDAIVENNGVWTLEGNADLNQNPNGSFFQSVHHLFCNLTDVPTHVLVSAQDNHLFLTTHIARSWGIAEAIPTNPDTILPQTDTWYEVRLRY